MAHQPPKIEPIGLRKHQQGCARWLTLAIFVAIIISFILSMARFGR